MYRKSLPSIVCTNERAKNDYSNFLATIGKPSEKITIITSPNVG